MPFTFSHPALVLSLLRRHRRWVSATGLVLGSMAPDFEKFFRMELANQYSHSLLSIFYFSCPVALALAFVFHQVVRRPLLRHLPLALRVRLGRYYDFDWPHYFQANYPAVLLCIILGAASHLFWDSFTHVHGRFVRLYPELRMGLGTVPLYQLLGWLSSLGGALALGLALRRLPPGPVPAAKRAFSYWWVVAGAASGLGALRLLGGPRHFWDVVISGIAALLGGLVLASWAAGQQR